MEMPCVILRLSEAGNLAIVQRDHAREYSNFRNPQQVNAHGFHLLQFRN